jgi:AAA domain
MVAAPINPRSHGLVFAGFGCRARFVASSPHILALLGVVVMTDEKRIDWKELAEQAWENPGWTEAAQQHDGPRPYGGNGKAASDEISLPPGVICDGGAATAPRPKLINGLLSTTGLVFLGGQGSVGKTFIAVAMAVALATGEPFFGRTVNEKVGTLIIAAEGREDMQARIAAAKKHISVEHDLPILWMAVPEFGDALLKDLDRINAWMKIKHDVRLGVVMLDTVSASFALADEADNAEAAKACKVLRQLGEHINGVMVPIHHYGKDPTRGLRGASAWSFNADMTLAVNAEIAPDGAVSGRSLAVTKDRGGIQGPVSAFELVSVQLMTEDGMAFTNLAVQPIEISPAATPTKWTSNAMRNLKRALEHVLITSGREEQPYSDSSIVRVADSNLVEAEFTRINVVASSGDARTVKNAQSHAYARALKAAQDRGLVGIKNQPDCGRDRPLVWKGRPVFGCRKSADGRSNTLGAVRIIRTLRTVRTMPADKTSERNQ